jgi:hypothetical protein
MNARLRVITLTALASITIVAVASMAQGSAGQPVILGQNNTSDLTTTITGQKDATALLVTANRTAVEGISAGGGGGAGIVGIGSHGSPGVAAMAIAGTNSDALNVSGRTDFSGATRFSASGVATIPAGATSVSAIVDKDSVDVNSGAVATLQQQRPTEVKAAVLHVNQGMLTIYLTRSVTQETRVAWFVFD